MLLNNYISIIRKLINITGEKTLYYSTFVIKKLKKLLAVSHLQYFSYIAKGKAFGLQ
jgi:hypothetical protein